MIFKPRAFYTKPGCEEVIRAREGSLMVEIWFFIWLMKRAILEDSSGMKTQHVVWITAQAPPWGAGRVPGAMGLCSGPLLITETWELSRRVAWSLSFKACWENFVNGSIWLITSPGPTEGAKIAAKWSCQRNTDLLTHWTHTGGKLAGAISKLLRTWPWVQENPRVHLPIQPSESQGHNLAPQNHWVPWGATQWIPGRLA